jgi:hypothetical protein
VFKDIGQPQKRVSRGVSTDRPCLLTHLLILFRLKGLLLDLKTGYNIKGLKGEVFFDVECATKNSEVHCDILLQPM